MDNDLLFRQAPPVRIGLAMARWQMWRLSREAVVSGQGNRNFVDAGKFGQREIRFASVPLMVRFVRNAGPASNIALRNVKPINFTRRKRGFPTPTLPSEKPSRASSPPAAASGTARNWGLP